MLKKIVFGDLEDLSQSKKRVEVEFGKRSNVIVGPKGGGKSTLFDLVAGLKKNVIYQNVIDALESFGLEFLKAEKFNGEIISVHSLSLRTAKTRLQDYAQRHDVIYQQDPIKENLHNSKEITKKKERFAHEVVARAESVQKLIEKISNFHHGMVRVKSFNDKQINWANLFPWKANKKNGDDLIIKLNYDSHPQIIELKRQRQMLEKSGQESQDYQRHTLWQLKIIWTNLTSCLPKVASNCVSS
ncbi:AAA family ATPase [Mycoplasma sp. ATU-Cv-508]|uniref:AAA family ATPase n=1 Tax=Mycoplasma sp. ATU-Cv-508 TaxID=2048001 RepID=UPI000FDCEE02